MPWVAALTLLNVKPPLLFWKAPIATATIGQQQAERHVDAERHDPGHPAQPAQGQRVPRTAAAAAGPATPGSARDPGACVTVAHR